MVSRKKAKGKARKEAKVKANAKVEKCAAFKPFSFLQFNKSSCTHGWTHDEYADNHDCHKFIVTFIEATREAFRRAKTVSDTFQAVKFATFEKYPDIWKDPTQLEWIASAFVTIGVEVLVQGDNNDGRRFLVVSSVTFSELIHQHVAFALHKYVPAMYSARLNELLHADNRRIISYLRKRIPCSCLNVHYNVVKHLPKKGICCFLDCSHPSRKVELSKMWSCGSCRREHYCSETCQAAEWSCHREDCKVWREWEATEDADSP
eukprot:scaffold4982_cov92-Skeletonema_dohrnii-CCMP3373.AAC.3